MSEENDVLMKLFAAELGKPVDRSEPKQVVHEGGALVGGAPKAVVDDSESDVLRLLGSGSMESIAVAKPIPSVSAGSLAMVYAISSGVPKDIALTVYQAMSGMRASDFRATLMAMAQATQPLNKGDIIESIVPRSVVDTLLNDFNPVDILQGMKQRANKKAVFIPPSGAGPFYLNAMSGYIISKMPDPEKKTIRVVLANKDVRVIPPVEEIDDEIVGQLLNDMRLHLDGAFETTKLTTELLVRLSLRLHPVGVQGQHLRPMDAASHERYVNQFIQAPWKETVEVRGKYEHTLIKPAKGLTALVNARCAKFVFPEGDNKRHIFASVLHAVATAGVTQFNTLWKLVGPFIDNSKQIFKISNCLDQLIWDAMPVGERLTAIQKNGWSPVAALRTLDSHRASRKFPVVDKLSACVDQPGFNNDTRLAQQEKIARVFERMKISQDGKERRLCFGIDEGFTVPYLAHRGFQFFDKVGKDVYGHPVLQLDVNNTMRLGEALKGAKVVLSDVAEASSGNNGAGDNLQRCSYMLNELSFSNIVQQCIAAGVEVVALKSFLPNTNVVAAVLPEAVKQLICHYDVKVFRCGKLHNDEIYYIGTRREKSVPASGEAYVVTLKELILSYGHICAQLEVGNELVSFALATGSLGPKWRHEKGVLQVSWKTYNPEFRAATAGEAAVWRYTHELSGTLTHGVGTLPIFGANKDLHVVEDGQDSDSVVALYKLFGVEADPAAAAIRGLSVDARVENKKEDK